MKELVEFIVKALVDNPDNVSIEEKFENEVIVMPDCLDLTSPSSVTGICSKKSTQG